MDARVVLALLCLFKGSYSLTTSEIAEFNNGVVVNKTINATYYKFTASGLPDHSTEKVNPNTASHQSHSIMIKKNPTITKNTCLPLGMIGMSTNGVTLFNPLTAQGYDAVVGEHKETFDSCNGHPTDIGEYHYHQLPKCLYNGTFDEFIGVALDGFPIYGPNVSDLGREIRQSDLDVCNGRNSTMNGVTMYRYFITRTYPYIMGCFRGDIDPASVAFGYIASYQCNTTVVGCNCPVGRKGPRPNNAACSIANLLMLIVLIALGAYISYMP